MSGELSEQAAAKILADLWALCARIVETLAKAGFKESELIICSPMILAAYAYQANIQDIEGFAQSIKQGILITHEAIKHMMKK